MRDEHETVTNHFEWRWKRKVAEVISTFVRELTITRYWRNIESESLIWCGPHKFQFHFITWPSLMFFCFKFTWDDSKSLQTLMAFQIFAIELQFGFCYSVKSSNKRKWKILSDLSADRSSLLLIHCQHNWSWKEITSIRVRRWMPKRVRLLFWYSFLPSSTDHNVAVRWSFPLVARSGQFGIQKWFSREWYTCELLKNVSIVENLCGLWSRWMAY